MAESNTLQTRISLKYDTYKNWTTNNPVLLAGEVAITVVPGSTGAVQNEPAVLLKVGDGTNHYNDLQFVSGKSADVYGWAMQPTKPTYTAEEITGLDDYISGQIEDTDTQYQVVRVSDTSFKLQSKPKVGGEWADVGSPIEITYTLTEGKTNGTVSFNGVDVAVHGLKTAAYEDASAFDAAGTADAAKSEVIGDGEDASSENTIYGAKKYADEKATAAQTAATSAAKEYTDSTVASAKTELIGSDDGVIATTIKGGVTEAKTYTDAQIGAKLAAIYKPVGSSAFAELPEPAVGILGNVYNVTDEFTASDRFIASEVGKKYPAGTNVAVVQVDEEYKYDALAGQIDLSNYATQEQAQGYANTAKSEAIEAAATDAESKVNAAKTELIGSGDATSTTIKDAVSEAKTYSDGLNTAMDGRMSVVEGKAHTHENKTVLDGINEGKVASWDAKVDDSDLAAIAKTGKVSDLVQDPGTYVILNCGTATTNI